MAWQHPQELGSLQLQLVRLPGPLQLQVKEVKGLGLVLVELMQVAILEQQPQVGLELVEQALEQERPRALGLPLLELEQASSQPLVLSWPGPRLPLLSMLPMRWQA